MRKGDYMALRKHTKILGILIIVPWSAWSILRARRDHWEDIVLPPAEEDEEEEPEHV